MLEYQRNLQHQPGDQHKRHLKYPPTINKLPERPLAAEQSGQAVSNRRPNQQRRCTQHERQHCPACSNGPGRQHPEVFSHPAPDRWSERTEKPTQAGGDSCPEHTPANAGPRIADDSRERLDGRMQEGHPPGIEPIQGTLRAIRFHRVPSQPCVSLHQFRDLLIKSIR